MHPTPDLADEFVLRLELAIPVLCLERVGSGVGGGGVEQKQRVVSALIELLVMRVGDLDELAVEIPSHHGSWEGSNLRRESCRFPNRHSLFVTIINDNDKDIKQGRIQGIRGSKTPL